jgi:hypothetical protein
MCEAIDSQKGWIKYVALPYLSKYLLATKLSLVSIAAQQTMRYLLDALAEPRGGQAMAPPSLCDF